MRRLHQLLALSLIALVSFFFLPVTLAQESTQTLELGKPLERELVGGQTHTYQFSLTTGQYLYLVVEQRGIDVLVAIFSPDGKRLAEVDSPNGTHGPEPLSLIAESSGNYHIEVQSPVKEAVAGRYEVKVVEARAATPQDRSRVAAERAFMAGEQLRLQETPVTLSQAIEKYEAALKEWRTVGDRSGQAMTLQSLGAAYYSANDMQKSLDHYHRALALWRETGDRKGESTTLNNIGAIYYAAGQWQKAIETYQQALPLDRALGDRQGETILLLNLGNAHEKLDERRQAITYFEQALPLARASNDRRTEASLLSNIASAYGSLGEPQKALEYNRQALRIRRETGNRAWEAIILNNMGVIYNDLGDYQQALEYHFQALPLRRTVGDRAGEAASLNNIGFIYHDLGEYQKALDHYQQTLVLWRDLKNRSGEASALSNMSQVYMVLGDYQKALDGYNQALPLWRAAGDRRGESILLNNIGQAWFSAGDRQKALEYFQQSLQLARAVSDPGTLANTLRNIGAMYFSAGDKQQALNYFNQALPLDRATGNRRGEASLLNSIGAVYTDLGEPQKALDYYQQSLVLRRAVGDRRGEAATLYGIARAERNHENFSAAQTNMEVALNLVESLRGKVVSQELRASYLASMQEYYGFGIDLLMQMHKRQPTAGFAAAALQINERARARSLLETLTEARADIRQGIDAALLERERNLQQQLNAKEQARLQVLSRKHTPEQAAAVEKELRDLTAQYQELQAQIKQSSPRYAALTQPQPLKLEEIQQQLLAADTLLLEYALGEERSYVWSVSPDAIASYELPKRAEIEAAARGFYAGLVVFNQPARTVGSQAAATTPTDTASAGASLSRMLLAPVAAQLGNKRLLIVADGALQYVPFGALPDPVAGGRLPVAGKNTTQPPATSHQPLITNHEIISLPSASSLAVLREELNGRKPAAKALALFADPVFSADDTRLQQAQSASTAIAPGTSDSHAMEQPLTRAIREAGIADVGLRIPRLPGTRREAAAITALVSTTDRKQALDFEANRTAVTGGGLNQYRIIHFATHGLLNSQHPELSGIVLSLVDAQGKPQDGFLRLHEIYNLKLPAELVVLSACQTGLGKEIKGEGLVGLTRGFMYAGAARVMASLWKVDDRATAELMKNFYQGMVKENLRPAAALRAAQVAMWKQQRWSEPYYWAAFVLQGEWK